MNVLLVDDAIDIRNTMHDYLDLFYNNINITEASNGEEALKFFRTVQYDIIITDEMMPIMKGSQFINEVYQQIVANDILTMVFSGQLQEDLRKQFATKPEILILDKVSNPMELKMIIDTKIQSCS